MNSFPFFSTSIFYVWIISQLSENASIAINAPNLQARKTQNCRAEQSRNQIGFEKMKILENDYKMKKNK
jgi:hypothetical protein